MAIKIILNILINIALIVLVLSLLWAFNNKHYPLMAAVTFSLALFVYFKIRLARSVKEFIRKKQSGL